MISCFGETNRQELRYTYSVQKSSELLLLPLMDNSKFIRGDWGSIIVLGVQHKRPLCPCLP